MIKRFAVGVLALGGLAVPFLATAPSAHAAGVCPGGRGAVGTVTYIPQSGDRLWTGGPVSAPLCSGVAVKLGSGMYGAKVVNLTIDGNRRARFTSVVRFRTPAASASATAKPTVTGSSAFLNVTGGRTMSAGSDFMTARFIVAS